MKTQDWGRSLDKGDASEKFVAGLLSATPGARVEWRRGSRGPADIVLHGSGRSLTIDVKADSEAENTGRLAIETVSVVETGAAGWAIKAEVDLIISHLPSQDVCTLYVMVPSKLRDAVPKMEGLKTSVAASQRRDERWTTQLLAIPIPRLMLWGLIEKTWKSWHGEPLRLL